MASSVTQVNSSVPDVEQDATSVNQVNPRSQVDDSVPAVSPASTASAVVTQKSTSKTTVTAKAS